MKLLTKSLSAVAISSLLAVTSLTASATAARADGRDVAGVLLGLGALYVVGRAIQERRDERRAGAAVAAPAPAAPPRQSSTPRRNAALVAPAQCFVQGTDQVTHQRYRGYIARCMQNNVVRPGSLPPQCITRVTTHRGVRNIYQGRCLRHNGWQREAGFRP